VTCPPNVVWWTDDAGEKWVLEVVAATPFGMYRATATLTRAEVEYIISGLRAELEDTR